MTFPWFVQERDFAGRWKSAIIMQREPPAEKTANGRRDFRLPPTIVPEWLQGLPLRKIEAFLTPDGEFAGLDEASQKVIADYLRDPANEVGRYNPETTTGQLVETTERENNGPHFKILSRHDCHGRDF